MHSHYWLSGWVGRALARDMGVPQITTFHTLSLIKMQARAGESEPVQRQRVERELIAEADRVVAFSPHERDAMVRLYGRTPTTLPWPPAALTCPGSNHWTKRNPAAGWASTAKRCCSTWDGWSR